MSDVDKLSRDIATLVEQLRRSVEPIAQALHQTAAEWQRIQAYVEATAQALTQVLPSSDTWVEAFFDATDQDVSRLGSRLAEGGWWFYPLVEFVPFAVLEELIADEQELNDERLDLAMTELVGQLLSGLSASPRGRLEAHVERALHRVDPSGARIRFKYFKQARRAFKLGGLNALIPPLMLGQSESLIAVASHRGLLSQQVRDFYQVFNSPAKAKKLVIQVRARYSDTSIAELHDQVLLPLSFMRQFDALTKLFEALTADVKVHDYASERDIAERSRKLPSRHYVVHGGLGADTSVHAAKALVFFVGVALFLEHLVSGELVPGKINSGTT